MGAWRTFTARSISPGPISLSRWCFRSILIGAFSSSPESKCGGEGERGEADDRAEAGGAAQVGGAGCGSVPQSGAGFRPSKVDIRAAEAYAERACECGL